MAKANTNSKRKGNFKGNGKKHYSKNGHKPFHSEEGKKEFRNAGSDTYEEVRTNDIAWWNKAEGVYQNVTKVPFDYLAGEPISTSAYGWQDKLNDESPMSLPFMMRINYLPGIGYSEDYTSPANRAFQAMYSAILSKTTGVLDFTAYSMAVTVICEQSIAQNLAMAKRALEVSNLWHSQNLSLPRYALRALGFNPTSILNHQNDVATMINERIKDFNTLKCPSTIDVFKRHYSLARNIWADMDSVKAQFYAFTPVAYYLFSDTGLDESGLLSAVPVQFEWFRPGYEMDIEDLMDIIDLQIRSLRSSHDFNRINAAFQRAFPDSSFLTVDLCTQHDARTPSVDAVMQYQIHNMTVCGLPVMDTGVPNLFSGNQNVYKECLISGDPVTDLVTYTPKLSAGPFNKDIIMNFFNASDVNESMIMEASRLMAYWLTADNVREVGSLGTEFVTNAFIYSLKRPSTGTSGYTLIQDEISSNYIDITNETPATTCYLVDRLSKFHLAPRVHFYTTSAGEELETRSYVGFLGDILHFAKLSYDDLAGLNKAALLSVFSTDVPIAIK